MLPLKNWCNFDTSASANVECCRGFMNVGTVSVQMKFWRGSVQILVRLQCECKCQCGMLSWLHDKDERWHSFSANEVLTWSRGKNKYWHDFRHDFSIIVECCHGFMTKMNCWHSFMASVRMKCWTLARLRCKWSIVVVSWQKWMLAQLRYEWSVDVASMQIKCWGSFMKKRVLVQL